MTGATALAWWHWWILAAVLAAAETLAPGAVAIWFAAAAAVVGALLWVLPLPWQWQLVLFGALGFAAILAWRRWRPEDSTGDAASALNQRGTQLVGQVFTLAEPLRDGSGRVRVGDGTWLAQGPDLPAGSRVRVVAVQGAALQVESAD
jgi:hypothetical protein